MHDLNAKISEESDYNEQIHEKHLDDSRHAMETFKYGNMEHIVANLIHKDNKQAVNDINEEKLYGLVPDTLYATRMKLKDVSDAARGLLNMYSSISAPMHEHESYEDQLELVDDIYTNLTEFHIALEAAPERLQELER